MENLSVGESTNSPLESHNNAVQVPKKTRSHRRSGSKNNQNIPSTYHKDNNTNGYNGQTQQGGGEIKSYMENLSVGEITYSPLDSHNNAEQVAKKTRSRRRRGSKSNQNIPSTYHKDNNTKGYNGQNQQGGGEIKGYMENLSVGESTNSPLGSHNNAEQVAKKTRSRRRRGSTSNQNTPSTYHRDNNTEGYNGQNQHGEGEIKSYMENLSVGESTNSPLDSHNNAEQVAKKTRSRRRRGSENNQNIPSTYHKDNNTKGYNGQNQQGGGELKSYMESLSVGESTNSPLDSHNNAEQVVKKTRLRRRRGSENNQNIPSTYHKDNNTKGYNGQNQQGGNGRGHPSPNHHDEGQKEQTRKSERSIHNEYTQPRIYHRDDIKRSMQLRGYQGHEYHDLASIASTLQAPEDAGVDDHLENMGAIWTGHEPTIIVRAPKARKKLLILDVNGLLADVVSPPPKADKADITISRKAIFKRPFLRDFVEFCFERFDVAIWSSRTKKYLDKMVDYLLGDMRCKLLFCWDQSHCTKTGFKTLENRHKDLFLKEVKKVWEKNEAKLSFDRGDYDESNTLLLDDSPYKALLNPIHSSIFPHSYSYKNKNDNSLGAEGDLRVYLTGLATAGSAKRYVEVHSFGQRPIDETNSSWAFYFKVITSQHSRQSQKFDKGGKSHL